MDIRHDFKSEPRVIAHSDTRRLQPEAVAIVAIIALFWLIVALRFAFDSIPW